MSIITPDSQTLNYTHAFSFKDMQGALSICTYRRGSIMHRLSTGGDFSLFTFIVQKAQMAEKLDDPSANYTLFAPCDEQLRRSGIDERSLTKIDGTFAANLVRNSMLERVISRQLIQDTPFFQMPSYDRRQFVFFSTVSGETTLNSAVKIIEFDIQCNNGVIHKLNKLLMPVDYY